MDLSRKELRWLEKLGLYFNEPEHAILCTRCGFAINPQSDRVSRHLREKHDISKKERWGLNQFIHSLRLQDPASLPLRVDGSRPHPHLALQCGSACKHCGLRSVSEKVLADHLRKEHEDKVSRMGRQQTRHWLHDHIRQGISFQSWAASDIKRSWIVVTDDPLEIKRHNTNVLLQASPDVVRHFAEDLFAQERARLEGEENHRFKLQRATESVPSTLLTNWLRRTGWPKLFKDARRDVLVSLTELPPREPTRPLSLGIVDGQPIKSPTSDERKLASMMLALDRLLDQCGETAISTDVCLRRWLRSRFPDQPYKAPFELVSRLSSEKLYRKELKRFICFWLRLSRILPATAKTIMGRRLGRRQLKALLDLWEDDIWGAEDADDDITSVIDGYDEYEDEVDDDEECEYEDEDEDQDPLEEDELGYGEDYESLDEEEGAQSDTDSTSTWSSDATQQRQHDHQAVDLLLRFCYFALCEEFEDGLAGSTMLVYFSAVRGLSAPNGDEYLMPHRFTPILSRFIYCSRLIFLEAVLPRFSHGYIGIPRRPRYGQLTRLLAARRRYMCDGTLSVMGEFLSLLSYGSALRRSQGAVFYFHWSEDGEVLSWDGNEHLSMENFRSMARGVLQSATALSARLMYDWEPPDINMASIRDSMATTTSGYSFVSDPTNQLTDAYLEVLLRACISPVNGLVRTQARTQGAWDAKAAQAYLEAHDDFLKTLMVLCNLDGGQCARISELLTVEYSNTSSRSRGVYIWGGRICSVTRHHKARLATNQEFCVARFFSQPVSRLLLHYLVYIRPLALAILRKCFHSERNNTVLLFAPLSKIGTAWDSSTFTKELRRYCDATPGVPDGIGVQLYRQISIAITERHVRAAAERFNRYDDVTGAARHDPVFAWQSGHRPMQRHMTYGLDGAYPDSLQPALLRNYARVSASWHAFLWGEDSKLSVDQTLAGNEATGSASVLMNIDGGVSPSKRRLSAHAAESPSNRKRTRLTSPTEAEPAGAHAALQFLGSDNDLGTASGADNVPIALPSPIGPSALHTEDQGQLSTESPVERPLLTIGPFVHLAQWNLMACIACKCAILATEAKSHLLLPRHNHTFSISERKKIVGEIMAVPGLVQDQDEMQLWENPPPDADPIPYIKPPRRDGLGCNECAYVVRNLQGIQAHYRAQHGWVNDWKRGGNVYSRARQGRPSMPWREGVICQRLCHWGYGSRWFEVSQVREEPRSKI
ncbi:hypothetical protein FDECE_17640 [Fusarium decemcellulare]|nr:hypothetical protein FDECE_17640 [Fusarium decemcellulare]